MATTKIGTYTILLSAHTYNPRIWLYDDAGLNIGQLVFHPNGTVLPANTPTSLNYHLDEYLMAVDLLRNEKPVYYQYMAGAGESYIISGRESVGDNDKV